MKKEILSYIANHQLLYLKKDVVVKLLTVVFPQANVAQIIEELLIEGDILIDEKGKISLSAAKGLIKGTIIGNKKGFAFCELEGYEQDAFIGAYSLNGAMNGDRVLVNIINRPRGNNPEGEVFKILQRYNDNVVGTFNITKNIGTVIPDNDKISSYVHISKGNIHGAQNGDKVVVKITEFLSATNDKLKGEIIEILGKADDEKTEQLALIRSFKVKEKFDEETLSEAKKLRSFVNEKDIINRRDFRALRTFTIDGIDTRDVDDALSVEVLPGDIYRIYVHIADVSHYVKQDSPLDKEAFERGTSVYFPDMVLPMLPKELSNGICSLNEDVDRLTLSAVIDLDKNAKVLKSEICESVIRVNKHLVYDDVTKAILGDVAQREILKPFLNDFLLLEKLTLRLEEIRRQRGELILDVGEAYIEVDDAGNITNITRREHTISHRIIESFMILANEVVASKYAKQKTPFVYRIHEKPDAMKLSQFLRFAESLGVKTFKIKAEDCPPKDLQQLLKNIDNPPIIRTLSKVLLRSLMKAKYSPECLGHYGLASTYYCHFTSPIRRYPDLSIHRIIKMDLSKKIKNENKSYLEDFVERSSKKSSEMEVLADEVERAVDDYKKAKYMKQFIGHAFDGIISNVTDFGFFVELENTVEGLVRLEVLPQDKYIFDENKYILQGGFNKFVIGDSVKVIVANVNMALRKVDFYLEGYIPVILPQDDKKQEKPPKKDSFKSKKHKIQQKKSKSKRNK